ncbi:MAG: hypothetical protein P8Z36_04840 [Gemmatimonadota bacterium]
MAKRIWSRVMKSISIIPVLLLVSGLAGCASLHHASEAPDAQLRFDDAVARYDYGDLAGATRELTWIRRRCAGFALGQQATLTLAALHLDSRNDGGQLDSAAALAGAFLHAAAPDDWRRPIAATLYLTALDLGAGQQDTTAAHAANPAPQRAQTVPAATPGRDCGPASPLPNAAAIPTLPVLPGEPLTARLRAVRADRGQLAATVDSLRMALDSARQELVAREKELERIRKTLKP